MDDINLNEEEMDEIFNKLEEIEPEFCCWLTREKLREQHPPTRYQNLPILLHPFHYKPPRHVAFDVSVTAGQRATTAPPAGNTGTSSNNGKAVMQVNAVDRPAWLPLDWKYDEKERTCGKTKGMVDKFYINPDNQTFRSKVAVQRYLDLQKSLLDESKGKEDGTNSIPRVVKNPSDDSK